jgi:hypothetical protein
MPDSLLWNTVCWLVRQRVPLFSAYSANPPHLSTTQAAAWWLRDQPTFRVMVKECIRRCFTFPDDVFAYLLQVVLDRQNTIDGYKPWNDYEAAGVQIPALADLADIPDISTETGFYKDMRSIRL